MKPKPLTLFLCAVTLLLLALSPFMLTSYFREPQESEAFRGILSLWHISDWRTSGSSSASFLQRRIKEFEASHPHVFIEITQMSTEDAAQALRSGEMPDMISYPSSYSPMVTFAQLPTQSSSALFDCDKDNTYPYMIGGYFAIVNTETMSTHGIDAPDSWGIRPEVLLEAAQHGVAFSSETGYSALPALALHEFPELTEPNISTWGVPDVPDAALGLAITETEDAFDAFCKSEICVLIGSHRQLFDIEAAYQQGDAPNYRAYALSGYTDMAQYIGITSNDDPLREAMCAEFAAYLVSESAQQKTTVLGVFPAVDGLDIYEDNEFYAAVYDMLCSHSAVISPQNASALDALALDAFTGDTSALRQLQSALRRYD